MLEYLPMYQNDILTNQKTQAIDCIIGGMDHQLTCIPFLTTQKLFMSDIEDGLVDNDMTVIQPSEKLLLNRYATNMVYLKVKGGIGNMLFQIFGAYGIARSKNVSLFVKITNTCPHADFTVDRYFGALECLRDIRTHSRSLAKYVNKQLMNKNCYNLTDDDGDPYLYRSPLRNPPMSVKGYLQHKRYFHQYRQDVIRLLHLPTTSRNQLPTNLMKHCMVHVRRDDYVTLSHIHRLEKIEYFVTCFKKLHDTENICFHFFSDDIEWCRNQPEFNGLTNCVFHDDDDETALALMSTMDISILTNSTYGWWGTYLNPKLGKMTVFQPADWFYQPISEGLILPNATIIREKLKNDLTSIANI